MSSLRGLPEILKFKLEGSGPSLVFSDPLKVVAITEKILGGGGGGGGDISVSSSLKRRGETQNPKSKTETPWRGV